MVANSDEDFVWAFPSYVLITPEAVLASVAEGTLLFTDQAAAEECRDAYEQFSRYALMAIDGPYHLVSILLLLKLVGVQQVCVDWNPTTGQGRVLKIERCQQDIARQIFGQPPEPDEHEPE